MKKALARLNWDALSGLLWAATLICLPLTSFPPFFQLTRAIVAPLSAVPVFLLAAVWLIPYLLRRGALPKESLPWLVFGLVALAAAGFGLLIQLPGFKEKSAFDLELRAGFTLAIGAMFYFIFAAYPQDEARLGKTLVWINIGGIMLLAWTLVQAYYMFLHADYPHWMLQIQSALSTKTPQIQTRGLRVSGLAYEPSWLSHQMVILYLPLWIAALFEKTSAFKLRLFKKITIEMILLPIGLAIFFLTSPRISLVSLGLMMIYLFLKINLALHRGIMQKIRRGRQDNTSGKNSVMFGAASLGIGLILVIIYLGAATGFVYVASQRDWRLALLFSEPPSTAEIIGVVTLDESAWLNVSHRLVFLERVVYWVSGWKVFNDYPWLGVGLGNSGTFFMEKAPAMGWASLEIREVIYKLASPPNIKSLWVRLLAETGLVGFAVFVSWFYLLWRSAQTSRRSDNRLIKKLALMGQLSLLAFLVEGFSIDSFAMPYLWVTTGLISAVGMIYRRGPANLSERMALTNNAHNSLAAISKS